jgi:hypothetical protein
MNPLARLSPALYTALSGLAVVGVPVPVYEHSVPADTRFYVLLSEPAILASGGRPGCRSWRCEVVVQVITRFASDTMSSVPANEVAEQVLLRLDGVALPLPEHWQCMPGQLLPIDDGPTPAADMPQQVVRRLRLRWEVYCHAPAGLVVPEPEPLPLPGDHKRLFQRSFLILHLF